MTPAIDPARISRVARLAGLLVGFAAICGGGPALADKTLDDFFPVLVEHRGASYVDARDAILAAAARSPEAVRARLEETLSAGDWRKRLAAEILLGWIDHRDDFTLCAIYARGDLAGPKPLAGFKPYHRGEAIAGLGKTVTPRILELLLKTGECTEEPATDALFHALTVLKDPRSAEAMLDLAGRKGERDLRGGALRVLSALGDPRGIEPALRIAGDPWEPAEVRTVALYALEGHREAEVGQALLGFLERPDVPPELRLAAAETLYRRADPATRPGLLALLPRLEDATVLPTLLLAIGEVGTEADIPGLRAYAATAGDEVRSHTARTIDRILRRKRLEELGRDRQQDDDEEEPPQQP